MRVRGWRVVLRRQRERAHVLQAEQRRAGDWNERRAGQPTPGSPSRPGLWPEHSARRDSAFSQ